MAAELSVLVSRSSDHLTWRSLGGFGFESSDQLVHAMDLLRPEPWHIIRRALVVNAGGVQMHVVEAGGDCLPLQVDNGGPRPGQTADLGVGANGGEVSVGHREGLGVRLCGIDCDHSAVDVDGVRSVSRARKKQERYQAIHESPKRCYLNDVTQVM
jgi:hypothetical protein